jgi:hypothetical protein
MVGDNDIKFFRCDFGERILAVFGYDDFPVGCVQGVGDGLGDGWFVIDGENMEFLFHARNSAFRPASFWPNADGFSSLGTKNDVGL